MLTLLYKRIFNFSASKSPFLRIKSAINTFCTSESPEITRNHLEQAVIRYRDCGYTDAVRTLDSRINFFQSIGILSFEIPMFLLANQDLFKADLKDQLIPSYDYLKFLVMDDEKTAVIVNRYPELLVKNADEVLLFVSGNLGESNSRTEYSWVSYYNKLKPKIRKAIQKETDDERRRYTVYNILCNPCFESTWRAYMKWWHLTDDEIQMAFFSNPSMMNIPSKRVDRIMHLFMNRMGFTAERIARSPVVLSYNLENRIEPRSRVIRFLKDKGILKKDIGLTAFLAHPDTKFLEKYVENYEDKFPELLQIYNGVS